MVDRDYMERALFHAARGRGRTSPNPLVGAVVVSPDGVIVGQGFHEQAGAPHAEAHALVAAGARARGATLYCTLEPCCHQGRTGPCVTRIVESGIARVVASVEDPNPVVQGRGFAYLRAHGVAVDVGEAAETAIALNQPFFTLMHDRRPFVILKAATSLDGRIAAAAGHRTPLTSAPANRHAHRVRAEVDAIAVGVGTILADDPELTARGAYRERPLTRVIFDRQLRTPPHARIFSTRDAGPVMIMASAASSGRAEARAALEARGAEIEVADGTLRSALRRLGERQVGSLLLEGGAAIHAAAWDDHLVDYVRLYVTPHTLGERGVPLLQGRPFSSAELRDRRAFTLGPDTVIEGYVHRPR
ncbi:MAG: bifunctional diaminohydroxyphosphoribosylaminopyrimidine deaminase/5-amino-6-(5-phosphoribosylamino)uracil reductase RibD [Acidobacteria bacterium]|nr:bifunctional diaminohydroxyphosphoribosylaminopyrimidine deaminase/5-amino-6-(5-phosphoribosylamino)uracil reductase RibD [Acidobacteriota bacterium]